MEMENKWKDDSTQIMDQNVTNWINYKFIIRETNKIHRKGDQLQCVGIVLARSMEII